MKRLLKEREKLQAKKSTARMQGRLGAIERQLQYLQAQAKPKTPPRKPSEVDRSTAIPQRRPYRDLTLIGDEMGNECVARPNAPTSHKGKPVGQLKPLLRERKTVEMATVGEAVRQAELRMVLDLQPLVDKAVQEAEQSTEWADSPRLANAKQMLERMRTLREQIGRTEPKQRAGS